MTAGVASLGMYDSPAVQAANDALWGRIAARLRQAGVADVPARLDHTRPLDAIWSDPRLLFAQCCGYPLTTRYRERLRVIATPIYAAAGCEGPLHRSRIIVRIDDEARDLAGMRGRRAAVNDPYSNSGMNVFRAAIAPIAHGRRFFADTVMTGAHVASIAAVGQGRADVAAIDAVTFAHAERDTPRLTALVRTLGWTEPTPALPFVTAASASDALVDLLRRSVAEAIADGGDPPATLFLSGVADGVDYAPIAAAHRAAIDQGYPYVT